MEKLHNKFVKSYGSQLSRIDEAMYLKDERLVDLCECLGVELGQQKDENILSGRSDGGDESPLEDREVGKKRAKYIFRSHSNLGALTCLSNRVMSGKTGSEDVSNQEDASEDDEEDEEDHVSRSQTPTMQAFPFAYTYCGLTPTTRSPVSTGQTKLMKSKGKPLEPIRRSKAPSPPVRYAISFAARIHIISEIPLEYSNLSSSDEDESSSSHSVPVVASTPKRRARSKQVIVSRTC